MRSLHEGVDVLGDVTHQEVAVVALDHVAVLVEQELLEVPRDVRARHGRPQRERRAAEAATGQHERVGVTAAVVVGVDEARLIVAAGRDHDLALHPLEQRLLVRAVDVALLQDRDRRVQLEVVAGAHVLEGVHELVVSLVGLVTELRTRVARKRAVSEKACAKRARGSLRAPARVCAHFTRSPPLV